MIPGLEMERMTPAQKLQAIEALWNDLAADPTQVDSPSWHEDCLRETEARVAAGHEAPQDWEAAKEALRKRFE